MSLEPSLPQPQDLIRLDALGRGQVARVTCIDPDGTSATIATRLIEMGLGEGTEVEVLHWGPLGANPLAVRAGTTTIAMRRAEARLIEVSAHP